MKPLSPTQMRLLCHLLDRAGSWVNSWELRDACAPKGGDGNIRVQMLNVRRRSGAVIESRSGPYGGYRLVVPA